MTVAVTLAISVTAAAQPAPGAGSGAPVADTDPVSTASAEHTEPARHTAPDALTEPISHTAEPHTAATVVGAPRPGQESGRADEGEDDSTLRLIGRGFLAVPRGLFAVVFSPVRGGVWAVERYHVYERTRRLFFNDAETIGLYPTVKYESDSGLNLGATFVAKLGKTEHFRLRAGAGGRYRQIFSGRLRGEHLGERLYYELTGEYEQRPKERFYGLGNRDEIDAAMLAPGMQLDALSGDTAVETRYRQRLARGAASVGVRAVSDLHVRGAATYTELELSPSDTVPGITEVYQPSSLIGFDQVHHVYGELELAWDSRRSARRWEAPSMYATGWLISAFAGRVAVEQRVDFWRYGGELQRFLRFGWGPRVIALRFHGEGVSAPRENVPFIELPTLGGSSILRGYSTERFRDRVAAFGSAEYEWDLAQTVFASVFIDAGRVYSSLDAVTLDELRYGYGAALEVHSRKSFLMRASISSSLDGGLFMNLTFDPVFDVDPRAVRR